MQRQGDIIFATLFVYGNDGSSTWLVAPEVRGFAGTPARWEGLLYRATGPAFSAPYDKAAQAVQTGTATIDFSGPGSATLRYTVEGISVAKQITRMTWRGPSASGRYYGGFSSAVPWCVDPTRVGAYDFLGTMEVTQSGNQMTGTVTSSGHRRYVALHLHWRDRILRDGLASWRGNFNCTVYVGLDARGETPVSTLRSGSFSVGELAISSNGMYGAMSGADQDCVFSGYFGGTRMP